MELSDLFFSPLDEESLIATFDCGLADITAFLHDDALVYQSEKMANTYLFEDGNKNILAFFSISNDCLNDLGEEKGFNNEEKGFNNNIWNRLHRALRLSNPKRNPAVPSDQDWPVGCS